LDALPPALERRFIASPVGLRHRSRSKAYPGSGLFVRLTNRYDANSSSSAFLVADAHYQEVVDRRKQLDRKCFIIEPD
jgi:hypothetical protein